MARLVADGSIGTALSTTLVARGGGWGGMIPTRQNNAYLLDKSQGATMLTIPVGHTLAALRTVLGDVVELSSVLSTRRETALVADTGDFVAVSAPDQVLVSGILASGAPVSLHYRGGMPRDGHGFEWEINGTGGDLRLTAPFGHPQLLPLSLQGAFGEEKEFRSLNTQDSTGVNIPENAAPGNVARVYAAMARDLRDGTRATPSFDDAVAVHRVLGAIEQSSLISIRVSVGR